MPRVAQPPVIQEGLSGVPSGSGGYVGGMEYHMDDDDDAHDYDFEVRNLLWQLWRIGILLGWLIIDRSGFPHSKPDSAASIKPRSKYEEFSLYLILQSLYATS